MLLEPVAFLRLLGPLELFTSQQLHRSSDTA